MGYGICGYRVYLPLLPRAENCDLATWCDHGIAFPQALDIEVSCLGHGLLGALAAINQNFMGWVKISKGEFAFDEQIYIDPFLLSAGSLFIIIGQLWLILTKAPTNGP